VILAVVSGKGGTGKTTVATSLATAWLRDGPVLLADCDPEGPNTHHFLPQRGELTETPVTVPMPSIESTTCVLCGDCVGVCAFNALAALPDRILLIESLCHACGGCALACPRGAIREEPRQVGVLRSGSAGGLGFLQGVLAIGEPRATAVIEATIDAVRTRMTPDTDVVLDGPPGASCPVASVVRAADVCLLVTEPTSFGLHDLIQAHELIAARGKPSAVILNRARGDSADTKVEAWCRDRKIPLLLAIPDRRSVAEAYSRGVPLLGALERVEEELRSLRGPLRRLADASSSGAAA
jgi:MinD superfamily P-loop ATPase